MKTNNFYVIAGIVAGAAAVMINGAILNKVMEISCATSMGMTIYQLITGGCIGAGIGYLFGLTTQIKRGKKDNAIFK